MMEGIFGTQLGRRCYILARYLSTSSEKQAVLCSVKILEYKSSTFTSPPLSLLPLPLPRVTASASNSLRNKVRVIVSVVF